VAIRESLAENDDTQVMAYNQGDLAGYQGGAYDATMRHNTTNG
jgi:phospholipid/cholesterol/gamma-HCH transport system ATP-binding protein